MYIWYCNGMIHYCRSDRITDPTAKWVPPCCTWWLNIDWRDLCSNHVRITYGWFHRHYGLIIAGHNHIGYIHYCRIYVWVVHQHSAKYCQLHIWSLIHVVWYKVQYCCVSNFYNVPSEVVHIFVSLVVEIWMNDHITSNILFIKIV